MELYDILNQSYPVSQEACELLEERCERITFPAFIPFIESGKRCYHLYFCLRGLMRMYHAEGEDERTIAFGEKGVLATSCNAFVKGKAALLSIETLEESEFLRIPIRDFKELIKTNLELHCWWSAALIEQLLDIEDRCVNMAKIKPYDQYKGMLQLKNYIINTDLIHRIPVKYVAQYLGVARETVSRIRSRIAREPLNKGKSR